MNRQYSPGLDRIGKNILVNIANIAMGKVQIDSGLNHKSQISKYKQTLITEILNPKQENPKQSPFWTLVIGTSEINWILEFGTWYFPASRRADVSFPRRVNLALNPVAVLFGLI